jgi:hypothetical protein
MAEPIKGSIGRVPRQSWKPAAAWGMISPNGHGVAENDLRRFPATGQEMSQEMSREKRR